MPNGKSNVEYKYTETENHIPSVQDGIVITDEIDDDGSSIGNEFVWIPVGQINNKEGEVTQIDLARYKFDITWPDYSVPVGTGTATPVQHATEEDFAKSENYSIVGVEDSYVKGVYCYESINGNGNTTAKELKVFLDTAKSNHGYYLARYEASYGGPSKPLSKPSTGEPETESGKEFAPTVIGKLWNNIIQTDAATAARNMYEENENYSSDLVNSYAWDTAIVFIQKYSGDEDYSKQNSRNTTSIENTGERNGTTDKVCNIYDMASNGAEWTTETSNLSGHPCVWRGGKWNETPHCTAWRSNFSDTCSQRICFRTILYEK